VGFEIAITVRVQACLGRVLDTERDRIFGAFASKCLSNVGPASARGSPRPGWQREQEIQRKMMAYLLVAFVVSLASLSSLHAQSPTPARSEAPPKAI